MALSLDDRQHARRRFLEHSGYAEWSCSPFSSDASFRSYFRLQREGVTVLLMDAPPPQENAGRFKLVAKHLLDCGIRAPNVLASDLDAGFLIIEDFGDDTLTRLLDRGEDEEALYTMAVDALTHLHRHENVRGIDVGDYDDASLKRELGLFVDWFFPAATGKAMEEDAALSFYDAWESVWRSLPEARQTLVLRDYHVDNIMRVGPESTLDACGLLDFQDAVIGPRCFDLMSLLEDARRDVSEETTRKMITRYKRAMSDSADPEFDTWYSVMAVHRHMRILGVFVRLWRRDGKPAYLRHLPRVARLLLSHRDSEDLHPVFEWLDRHIPHLAQTAASLSEGH
ncbi:MAG: phosphotransferase [Pseudomonadota bacterium]